MPIKNLTGQESPVVDPTADILAQFNEGRIKSAAIKLREVAEVARHVGNEPLRAAAVKTLDALAEMEAAL